jgi:multidrug efflux pump subunit AcrA (membrane-fusion protein)
VPSADRASRTFDAHLVVDNADGRLKTGMFARARFDRGTRSVMTVPRSAIVERGQLTGLYVVDDGHARLRWIRKGRSHGDRVEVLSGLEVGDRYVTSPPAALTDGAAVNAG